MVDFRDRGTSRALLCCRKIAESSSSILRRCSYIDLCRDALACYLTSFSNPSAVPSIHSTPDSIPIKTPVSKPLPTIPPSDTNTGLSYEFFEPNKHSYTIPNFMAGTTISTDRSNAHVASNTGSHYSATNGISHGTEVFILKANDFRGNKEEESEGSP